jgi:hypothetical protein
MRSRPGSAQLDVGHCVCAVCKSEVAPCFCLAPIEVHARLAHLLVLMLVTHPVEVMLCRHATLIVSSDLHLLFHSVIAACCILVEAV